MAHLLITAVLLAGISAGQTADATSADTNSDAAVIAAVLKRLEDTGKNLQTIRAEVTYTVNDVLNLTETTKRGVIRFKRTTPHPIFLIHFDHLNADGVIRRDKEWWLLRDRWLWEAKGKSRTILKREVYRPGEEVDFFDLERSPIPMPFGQRQAEIERNFEVTLMAPQLGDPKNCDHLYCVPRPNVSLAKQYKRLEYYVSRELNLPVRIVAENAQGNKVTVAEFPTLSASDINIKFKDGEISLPKETKGFNVTEEPLKDREDRGQNAELTPGP